MDYIIRSLALTEKIPFRILERSREKKNVKLFRGHMLLTLTHPQCLFLPVHIDTKNRYIMDFLAIKQYLISISPLTVKRSCLNCILLKR